MCIRKLHLFLVLEMMNLYNALQEKAVVFSSEYKQSFIEALIRNRISLL